eukprot:TRINITY_DN74730_c0_g1_i1.p1 TRINITY_DN74730_c0_g1~~TRINITY_DN74730_c0_g1_i1.p1  ORF type:complete len:1662 (-),score=352.24 TRINITY_DN74730_c0_g1_i1:23-5008(-)
MAASAASMKPRLSHAIGKVDFLAALSNRDGTHGGSSSQGPLGSGVGDGASDSADGADSDDACGEDDDDGEASPTGFAVSNLGGVIAPSHDHAKVQQVISDTRQVRGLERLQREFVTKSAAADDARRIVEHEEQRLRDLRRQAEKSDNVDPAKLRYQEAEVENAWEALTKAETARDKAELILHTSADKTTLANRRTVQDVVQSSAVARARQLDEANRATQIIRKDAEGREAARERQELEVEERARRESEAKKHKAKAARRLAEAHKSNDAQLKELEQIHETRLNHDAQRLVNMKRTVEGINLKVQASNEKRTKKEDKKRLERDKRFKELLDSGQNPYEVFRKEDMDAEKQRQKKDLEEKQVIRSEKLMEQLLEEDRRYKIKKKDESEKRKETESFQREMGNYAREKRVASYIRKMTIGNVDVLDPTGTALRIDPSKVTIQRTHAFGIGGLVSMDEIKKVNKEVKVAKARAAAAWKPPRAGGDDDDPGDFAGTLSRAVSSGANDGQQDAGSTLGDEDAVRESKLWVPKLTKLEEQYLTEARERQKQSLMDGSVQKCWGKEFKGDAFLAKPSVITFSDFEVGKRYRRLVEVTNVSLTFNQFKLLPLEDEVKEFFEIDFVPPGRMSAGVTRYLTVWFTPKQSKDIETKLPILAKTGRINFDVRCTTKKTILAITPQSAQASPFLDFGHVVREEEAVRVLQIKNAGALSADFELTAAEGEDEEFLNAVTWDSPTGVLAAHATTHIRFTFRPTTVRDYKSEIRLSINNKAVGDARLEEEKEVSLIGVGTDVPIQVAQEVYDLKTALFDHIFRETVMIFNRQSAAMKVTVESPKAIEGELQITPTLAFVQGRADQGIQVKFSPKKDFLEKHPEFADKSRIGPNGRIIPGAFRIPIQIEGVRQKLPVCTEMVGTLTTNDLVFEPKSLSFGRCFVGASVSCRLAVINESLLPQRYAFMRLPSYLTVEEIATDALEEEALDSKDSGNAVLCCGGEGTYGMLLPQERRELFVTYTPEAQLELKHSLNFKAITGSVAVRDFAIQCTGQGVTPVLSLSHTQIDMTSIPVDAATKESIVITNVSNVPYTINILVPPVEVSGLSATPVCCQFFPREQRRLQVEFKPTRAYADLLKLPVTSETEEPPEGEGEPVEGDAGAEPAEPPPPKITAEEHRMLQLRAIRRTGGRRWEAPAHFPGFPLSSTSSLARGEADAAESADDAVGGGGTGATDGAAVTVEDAPKSVHASWRLAICLRPSGAGAASKVSTIYLGVKTCVLPSVLTAEPSTLNFGQVTAGQREIMTVTLRNAVPSEPQELRMEALPESACFTVLNAPRTIGDTNFTLIIEFKPERVQIYQSSLRLHTQNTRIQVSLSGRGVRPVLKIEPEDGIIHLGSVVYNRAAKDYATATLEVKNTSEFEMLYRMEPVVSAELHHVGPSPFTLTPSTASVEGHGSKTVTVTFRPHRPLEIFKEKILVNVPNQKEPTYLYLYGHCFQNWAYAIPGMIFGPFSRERVRRAEGFVDALAVGSGSGATPEAEFQYPRAQRREITLVFERGETSKFLIIGVGAPPGTPTAPQNPPPANYELQIQPSAFINYFTVEAPEGGKPDKVVKGVPLKPGDKAIKAVFRYSPPENESLTVGDVTLDMLSGIGQWITCNVRLLLNGEEIMVHLRAYLQQI